MKIKIAFQWLLAVVYMLGDDDWHTLAVNHAGNGFSNVSTERESFSIYRASSPLDEKGEHSFIRQRVNHLYAECFFNDKTL